MVIECSSCHARFKLADDKVKENGTKVRCTKCREVFTVFPESPPIIPPVNVIAPVVTINKDEVDDEFFSLPEQSPVTAGISPPATDVPISEEDDWDQEVATNPFTDEFSDEAGSSDLDAINFDNLEAPVFSVTTEKNSKFEFANDNDFSFEDSPLEGETALYNIRRPTDDQSLAETRVSEDLIPSSTVVPVDDFSFPAAENLTNFSWDEPESSLENNVVPEYTAKAENAPQDTAFDFSSFSFDDVPVDEVSGENEDNNSVTLSETTIELLNETDTSPAPTLISPSSIEIEGSIQPAEIDHHKNTSPSTRPLRPRSHSRKTKKGSSRLAIKVFLAFFLLLTLVYGIMNREQLQKEYKNLVNSFIEGQVRVETNGRIGLVKLSGGYLLNNQEGNLFVIRGEAVNEFKGLRSSVLVRGTIFGEKGVVVQSQSAYGGNHIKDSILKTLGYKEIRDVMNNELGENLANMNISPGKGIPFTIVFNNVPENIKEFTVEVLDFKPGSK